MMQSPFQYRAMNAQGAMSRGVVHAQDRHEAYRQLIATGLRPINIARKREFSWSRRNKRVTQKDLAHFTRQFAVLMDARISIVEGLRSLAEQEHHPRLRAVLSDVAEAISGGATLTDALRPHRDLFGDVYVETVHAAEASGNLVDVLNNLADVLERQYEMAKTVKGALMYPLCVIGTLFAAVLFLVIVIVPKFAGMFESRGVELPQATQMLMAVSAFFRTYWYIVIGAIGLSLWGLHRAWRHPAGRERIDSFLHYIPFVRAVLKGLAISRFVHVFSVSLRSGLSVIDALEMSGKASGRPLLTRDAQKMREQVNSGGQLSDCLSQCSYLPPFTRRMLSAGEEAAELSRMCDHVARHYDREVAYLAKNVATVIEPILIVGLAVVVLIIALAIFLPMWNMAALIH